MKSEVILGSPGCGKTQTLLDRISNFRKIYAPNEIAFISHTKAAAAEALSRLNINDPIKIATIHSLCYNMRGIDNSQVVNDAKLKEFSGKMGMPMKCDNPDFGDMIEIGDEMMSIYNYSRAVGTSFINCYMDSNRPGNIKLFEAFVKGYKSWKLANGYIDFHDMLMVSRDMANAMKIKALIIDEAQDLSNQQWFVVNLLAEAAKSVIVAGDDDQSIYTWGGANPLGIKNFITQNKSKITVLEQSWRMPKAVHRLAERVINNVKERINKEYKPRDEEGEVVKYGHFNSSIIDSSKETLLLYRNHAIKKDIEWELISNFIPYSIAGTTIAPMDNKIGRAIKTANKMISGNPDVMITEKELTNLKNNAASNKVRDILLDTTKWYLLKKYKAVDIVSVPAFLYNYYKNVNSTSPIMLKLSTIHAAKGKESDNVILINSMTQRTSDSMERNPDAEYRVFYVGITRAKHSLKIIEGDNRCKIL